MFWDNAEDLDIVMPMYNLLKYNGNYSMTENLWNYYRDEVNNCANENDKNDNLINNNKTATNKYFKSERETIERAPT